jgi:hypothetical protein
MTLTATPFIRQHLLLIQEQGSARMLRFATADTAELIAGALAAAAGLPAPVGTTTKAAVGGPALSLSLWAISCLDQPRLAVIGESSDGPLIVLARDECEALALRRIAAGRAWHPQVIAVEDGLTADLSQHEPPSARFANPPMSPTTLSALLCPQCEEHPLHADPVFDDRSRVDGARICNACGNLEALRLDRYARLTSKGDAH